MADFVRNGYIQFYLDNEPIENNTYNFADVGMPRRLTVIQDINKYPTVQKVSSQKMIKLGNNGILLDALSYEDELYATDYTIYFPEIDGCKLNSVSYLKNSVLKGDKAYPESLQDIDITFMLDTGNTFVVRAYYETMTTYKFIVYYKETPNEKDLISPKIIGIASTSDLDKLKPEKIEGYARVSGLTQITDTYGIFYYKKDPVEVGGQDATTDSENTYETTNTNPETALTDSNVPDYSASNLSKWNDRSDTYGFGCYFIRYEGGEVKEIRSLPVFPQEFSDTNSAEFNATSVLGRSVAYQTYNTSSRTVSFALTLHEEVVKEGVSKYYWSKQVDINNPDTYPSSSDGTSFDESSPKYNKVREIVAQIQAACYPEYKEGAVVPPEVEFVIGNQFSIRGILTSCGATWKPPIINGNYVCCDLSIGITETTGPYSSSDVVRLKGKRGSYNA